jgi:predicted nucleotidyltransferase
MKEEEQEFQDRQFKLENLQKFREKNKTFLEIQELNKKNLGLYEMFAVWTEYYLSKQINSIDNFEKKYNSSERKIKENIESVVSFNENYGDLATFYNFGLAKRTTPERVKKLLEEIYKDNLNEIQLAVLYGSRKEFSDIDILLVSDKNLSIESTWLDIRIINPKEFKEKVELFDASIIGPLFNSQYLRGDKDYFEKSKEQMIRQPITKESIEYNATKGKEQEQIAMKFPEDSIERKRGLSYFNSYLENAFALSKGRKIFDKDSLRIKNERFIEIK